MATTLECSFLIPVRRDADLSDGQAHPEEAWDWLYNELFNRFSGATIAPGVYQGFYRDPDTKAQVHDESMRITVAVGEADVEQLRHLLAAACVLFGQKCIYLSIAGSVEFIEASHGKPN
ncbi:MAG TPA: hypothetical protein VMP01_19365 [Pirellulaceae bacterium]|nr:hypothetical protein [Pirellulaceae bacterium]